jgi:hypothetical protein
VNIDLTLEIEAFKRAKSELIARYGSAWVVFVDASCKGQFSSFQQAAEFALDAYPHEQFLIRHTTEPPLQVPMVAVQEG